MINLLYEKTQKWHSNLIDDDLNLKMYQTDKNLFLYIERILNNNLREALKNLRSLDIECTLALSFEIAKEKFDNATDKYQEVMEELGKVLRELY